MAAEEVVVWTRDNDYKRSIPYPPEVSNGIEQVYLANKGPNLSQIGRIQLGPFDPDFTGFSVDFGLWKQCQCDSGRRFTVHRSVLDTTSASAKGYVWEYEGDTPLHWLTYDIDTMRYLEKTYTKIEKRRPKSKKRQPVLNLKRNLDMPYHIDVETMQQTRIDTGKVRDIQRRPLTQPYLTDALDGNFSSSSSSSDTGQSRITRSSLNKRVTASGQGTSQQTNGLQSSTSSQQPVTTTATAQQPSGVTSGATSLQINGSLSLSTFSQQQQATSATAQQPSGATGGAASAAKPKPVRRKKQGSELSNRKAAAGAVCEERDPLPSENKIRINSTKSKALSAEEVVDKYSNCLNIFEEEQVQVEEVMDVDEDDKDVKDDGSPQCYICFDKLSEPSSFGQGTPEAHVVVQLKHCKHKFHRLCLVAMCGAAKKSNGLQCPCCKYIYGEKTGTCPSGVMTWDILQGHSVAGYSGYDTISVTYDIRPGVQGPEHPKPGQPFYTQGFPRVGYLPDTNQGRKVLKLMIEAWRRRLMFTVGTSYTTGSSDVVTWNEIHHKTELHGNHWGHGYPDPTYLDNVVLELADHGVTEDSF